MSNKIVEIEDYQDSIILDDVYIVERIVDRKKFKGKVKYLVKWEGYPEDQNTWEPIENLNGVRDLLTIFDQEYENRQKERTLKKKNSQIFDEDSQSSEKLIKVEDQMQIDDVSDFKANISEIIEQSELKQSSASSKASGESEKIGKTKKEKKLKYIPPVREGDINTDIPLCIKGAKVINDEPFELNCLIEWIENEYDGVKPADSWVTSKDLKFTFPACLIEFYEQNVKCKRLANNS
jgi:hypothetical protein